MSGAHPVSDDRRSDVSDRRAWSMVSGDLIKAGVTTLVTAAVSIGVTWMLMRPAHSETLAIPQAFEVYQRLTALETETRNVKLELAEIKIELRDLNKFLK